MKVGPLRIDREPMGVLSSGPCWVAHGGGHLYASPTLLGLLLVLLTQWKSDRHLVG